MLLHFVTLKLMHVLPINARASNICASNVTGGREICVVDMVVKDMLVVENNNYTITRLTGLTHNSYFCLPNQLNGSDCGVFACIWCHE